MIKIVSVRETPSILNDALSYIQKIWANENSLMVYEDCIKHSILSNNALPQWYVVLDNEKIIGCAGLITNDFISRMDLFPWICAIYIEKDYRGSALASKLMNKACLDAKNAGYTSVYCCTDHIGYYEKYGFHYIGNGYHPWGETSRIYQLVL